MPSSGHGDVALFDDIASYSESTQIENYIIIASLKGEIMGKLINRIPGSCLLISSLPGSTLRTHMKNCWASLAVSTSILKILPVILKLNIKRHSPVFSLSQDVNKHSQSLAW